MFGPWVFVGVSYRWVKLKMGEQSGDSGDPRLSEYQCASPV